jgi:dUTPase
MSNNLNNNFNVQTLNNLLNIYDKIMVLKIYIDSIDADLHRNYINAVNIHNNRLINNPTYIDAGFDLFAPGNEANSREERAYGDSLGFFGPGWSNEAGPVNKLNFKVCCSAKMFTDTGKSFNTGYYMYPRSSLSKTQLRLANSTGIIDSGYRGHLIGMFDVVNIQNSNDEDRDADYFGKKYDRYLQICAPGLVPIIVEIVGSKEELGEETQRGSGGFGSTGR